MPNVMLTLPTFPRRPASELVGHAKANPDKINFASGPPASYVRRAT